MSRPSFRDAYALHIWGMEHALGDTGIDESPSAFIPAGQRRCQPLALALDAAALQAS